MFFVKIHVRSSEVQSTFTEFFFKDENGGEGGKRGRVDVLELQVFLI